MLSSAVHVVASKLKLVGCFVLEVARCESKQRVNKANGHCRDRNDEPMMRDSDRIQLRR